MLSQTAEYALRAMVVLAMEPDEPRTAQQIAARSKVPLDYLAKILQCLARAHLVTGQRGRGGGFSLVRGPRDVTVYDVVSAVDKFPRIETCPLGLASHGVKLCTLHRKLDDAVRIVEESFRSTSLWDLLEEPSVSRPLCETEELVHVAP